MLKKVLCGLTALVVGLSVSQAFAATLVVDNFTNLGPIPPNSQNAWGYVAPSGVLQNSRELYKSAVSSTAIQWVSQPGKLEITTTTLGLTTTNNLTMRYDGNPATGTQYFNPRVDISAYSNGWLNIDTPSVAVGANTSAKATIQWLTAASGGTLMNSELTLTGGPSSGGYAFKLSDFSAAITNLSLITSVQVRLQALGQGTTLVNSIYFANAPIPEPGTLALAGLGLVGLVIARRKKSV